MGSSIATIRRGGWLASGLLLLVLLPGGARAAETAPALQAHLGYLPGLIMPDGSGPFVDLVRAVDDVYPGKIIISTFPFPRAQQGVISGGADFNLPALRNPYVDPKTLPFRFSTVSFGKVNFVLYSNTKRKLTPQMVVGNGRVQGLQIEAIADFWPFPVQNVKSIEQSLRKLALGRIDGMIWAQEEADATLRELGLKNIHRANLGDFDDVFLVSKDENGARVDAILGEAIAKLRASGRLKEIYSKIHQPHKEWQPYQQ